MDVATALKLKFRAGDVDLHERRKRSRNVGNDKRTYKMAAKKVLDACENACKGRVH